MATRSSGRSESGPRVFETRDRLFGATIAHGYLTLTVTKVRFPQPVHALSGTQGPAVP